MMNQRAVLKIAITKIAPLIELIKKEGKNINTFLSEVDLDADIFNYPDEKITLEKYYSIFTKGATLTNDRFFGLHAGELFTMMSNILGYIIMNCLTAGEALKKFIKYQTVTDNINKFDITQYKNNIIIEISLKDDHLDREMHFIDYNLASFVSYCRAVTGKQLPVIETRFRHSGAFNKSEYTRIFNSKLTFNAERNAIVVPKEFMAIPIQQPNKELLLFFEKHVDEFYKRMIEEDTYSYKVKKILVNSINNKIPSEAEISKHFSISTRSLQKKLKDEGTRYSAILNSIRKDIAVEYLKDKNNSIEEISFLLGFSEPSAFYRSFKKWTNMTPNTLRAKYKEYKNDIN